MFSLVVVARVRGTVVARVRGVFRFGNVLDSPFNKRTNLGHRWHFLCGKNTANKPYEEKEHFNVKHRF